MKEFFRCWRRKVGCLLLVFACMVMGAWIRGRIVRAEITIGTNEKDAEPKYKQSMYMEGGGWFGSKVLAKLFYQIISTDGIAVRRIKVENPEWSLELPVAIRETSYDAFKSLNEYVWRRQFCGIDVGERRDDLKLENVTIVGGDKESSVRNNPQLHLTYLYVPYWAIVVPVTLLSAFLLLVKPRSSNQKKTAELVPVDGP